MKTILRLGLVLALCSLSAFAAKNSQAFSVSLTSGVRVGDVQLQQGRIHVTWAGTSGTLVQLTITQGKNTVTVPARMTEEKHRDTGSVTLAGNGVTYLKQLLSEKATFVIQDGPASAK